MPVITHDTKKKIETLRQTIASSGPDSPLATNKAEVKWIEGQRSDGLVRGFSVVQDEPESVGGTSKAQPQQITSSHRSDFVKMSYLSETQA